MRSLILAASLLALGACAASRPAEHYGYVALLGNDTVSVERVTRDGDHLTIDGVDRFPRVRRRHTVVELGPDGGIRHLATDIRTPSEPEKQRERHVEAEVKGDSVHITKRDGSGVLRRDFGGASGAIVMAHVPQMYSLYDLYFEAARKHATKSSGDESVRLRQFYIDREFDRFPLHSAAVRLTSSTTAEIRHDWLSGNGEAELDSNGQLLHYSGAHSTYKVEVRRISDAPDVEAIGERLAALETKDGGPKELSVRDTVVARIGRDTFTVDYGRPLARGRVLVGNVLSYDRVWRTGANAATQFSTSEPISLGGIQLHAGRYTLWTVPHQSGGVDLIVNSQTGQWGTSYDRKFDVGTASMRVETLPTPVEKFTIAIAADGDRRGTLTMEWGAFRWTAPIIVAGGATTASR